MARPTSSFAALVAVAGCGRTGKSTSAKTVVEPAPVKMLPWSRASRYSRPSRSPAAWSRTPRGCESRNHRQDHPLRQAGRRPASGRRTRRLGRSEIQSVRSARPKSSVRVAEAALQRPRSNRTAKPNSNAPRTCSNPAVSRTKIISSRRSRIPEAGSQVALAQARLEQARSRPRSLASICAIRRQWRLSRERSRRSSSIPAHIVESPDRVVRPRQTTVGWIRRPDSSSDLGGRSVPDSPCHITS